MELPLGSVTSHYILKSLVEIRFLQPPIRLVLVEIKLNKCYFVVEVTQFYSLVVTPRQVVIIL